MAAVLAAALLALFIVGVKPAESQAPPPVTLTVEPTTIGFGAAEVDGTISTRTITVTNTGSTPIIIGDVDFLGGLGDFDLVTSIGLSGLTVGAGESTTLDVSFDPSDVGVKEATLNLTDLLGGAIGLVDQAGNVVEGIDLTGTGVDVLPTAPADCTIIGTNNGEVLTGTPLADVICALGGNDTVDGLAGDDTIRGGSGGDTIVGGPGKDRLLGEGGKDVINARDGAKGDFLKGGPGKDKFVKDRGDTVRK